MITEQRGYGRDTERSRIASRTTHSPNKSFIFKITVLVLILSSLAWLWLKITNPNTFPIRTVRIAGSYPHLNHDLLQHIILPFTQSGFVTIDTSGLSDRLNQLPWVYSVDVHRQWPDMLMIHVVEQTPVARYGQNTLLNSQGDLFDVDSKTIPSGLPVFVGQVGAQQLMLSDYQQMQMVMNPLHLKITALILDKRRALELQLNNGIIIYLGNIDPILRLQRFVKVYQQVIGNNANNIKSVDLRYSNGIAIGYRELNQTIKN